MCGHEEISKDDEARRRELMLDKTLADSFPASDPLSTDPNPYSEDAEEAA